MKKSFIAILLVLSMLFMVSCGSTTPAQPDTPSGQGQEESTTPEQEEATAPEEEESETHTKEEEEGTAGSNIPIKDNMEEAEYQIQVALQYLFQEVYGDKVYDARMYVEKMYTAEEEQEDELLKSLELGPDEVAFRVRYELKPAEGVDPNEFLAGSGDYDEESGWVVEKYNVGVLRPNPDGDEPKYIITDFGTSF